MPTIAENTRLWTNEREWVDQGENWSAPWGGSESKWFSVIYPRIHAFLPARAVVEIAPGFGRWTHYLKNYAEHLTVVDLLEECIQHCELRFASATNISYFVNDGKSLHMIPDRSTDFIFSFDSLVHVEPDVIEAYLEQSSRKLTQNGVGFIHHSNLADYRNVPWWTDGMRRPGWKSVLKRCRLIESTEWRAFGMSARLFESMCARYDLQCIGQELVNWRGRFLKDAFSLFTRTGSTFARPNRVIENHQFIREAAGIGKRAALYSGFQHD